jgi:hypothetical protein
MTSEDVVIWACNCLSWVKVLHFLARVVTCEEWFLSHVNIEYSTRSVLIIESQQKILVLSISKNYQI